MADLERLHFVFELADTDNNNDELLKLKEFQEELAKKGIILEVWEPEGNQEHTQVFMAFFKNKLNRNAGRRSKIETVNNRPSPYGQGNDLMRLSDIIKMQETMTDNEIVSQLNMSRATFYRHLKKAKVAAEKNKDYDPIF